MKSKYVVVYRRKIGPRGFEQKEMVTATGVVHYHDTLKAAQTVARDMNWIMGRQSLPGEIKYWAVKVA